VTAAPLAGIRVLDATTAWAGPFAGRVLAYLGAEVIHLEAASRLDLWRAGGHAIDPVRYPDLDPGARPHNRTVLFNSQNHNKLSVCIDIKKPGGTEALRELAATCDVVLANYTPGTLARMGIGYDTLKAMRPDIIVLEMPALGNAGPLSKHSALGPSMEFSAGMGAFVSYGDGEPFPTGPAYMDPIGGYNGAAAILTALAYRDYTGEGQYIEMAQTEAAMPYIGELILGCLENNEAPTPHGNWTTAFAPHDAFPTMDDEGFVAIAIETDAQWQSLCSVIGAPDLAHDARFTTAQARLDHQQDLFEPIARWTRTQSKHDAAALLQQRGVAAAPVNHGKDVAQSTYLRERGFFTVLDHPEAGRHAYQALPFHFRNSPVGQHTASPLLGQHTELILRERLGYSEDKIATLKAAGTISAEPGK
jgi:crotonobetainyl-CoA:carnitine CoA-transferase CaiB-like acyl-CoA transferase